MKKSTLLLAGAILVAVAAAYILSITNTQSTQYSEKITVSLSVDFHGNATAINKTAKVENGTTAFGLLNANAKVEYKVYPALGIFITTINGVKSDNEWYWIIFNNGKTIPVAADKFVLKDKDAVSYVYTSANESKKYFK